MGANVTRLPNQAATRRAFTLIEVLVVVAIIALLVSILLPSLARAKEQARTIACGSKLSQIGRSENAYSSEHKEWIPGSPWSTGYAAMMSTLSDSATTWPTFALQNRLIVDWYDYSTPLRAQIQGSKSIPRTRAQMLIQFTQGLFQCDSNPHTSVPYRPPVPSPTINSISYLSMWSLMRSGPGGYGQAGKMPFCSPSSPAGHVSQSSSWAMVTPSGYYPKHSKLGRDSMKVYLADGFRFYDPDKNIMDYDAQGWRGAKGIGNVEEPPSSAGSKHNQMYNIAREYAYRHGSKDAINALFFDGHVKLLRVNYKRAAGTGDLHSGYTGEAVHPKYYYPSGSYLNPDNPDARSLLHLPIPLGQKLP